ncbi:hypothetical protein HPB52_011421 [Rhipicephalus sanguineus]|uniref:Uncharacterized protein n=1 Tax=Rhipicephalus sanguineus TaxID=34632 RepID=A0A9D4T5L1_RHISA|nr:hypothetical protein HPB52_011421 [Rhipicephalus sanguineus]
MSKNKDAPPEATKIAACACHAYALNLQKNCPNLPPVEDIANCLEQVQTEFENADLDMQMPCTMTDTDPCWVLDNLRTLNRVLMLADIEIKEEEPRRLSVRSFDYARPARSNESALLKACILLDVLLKGHRCVQTLHLGQDIVGTRCAQILYASLAFNKSLKYMTAESVCTAGATHQGTS